MTVDRVRAHPLSPRQIREYRLPQVGWAQRGLDPEAVYRLLYRLADQIAIQNVGVRVLQDENLRIKQALRHWQREAGQR